MDRLIDQDPARSAALTALQSAGVAAGVPALVFANDPPRLVHANKAALGLFATNDEFALALQAEGAAEPVFTRLLQLNKSLRPGAPPRIERLRCQSLGEEAVSFNIRRVSGTPPLLIAFAPELADRYTAEDERVAPTPLPPPPAELAAPPAPELPVVEQPMATAPEDVARDLAARYDDASFVRFLWQTDTQNRLTMLSGPLCDVVRHMGTAPIGQDFVGFADVAGADPEGRLAAAFANRQTWSNLELAWPVAGTDASVTIVLGGLPTFDAAHNFTGLRGFGVIHLQKVSPFTRPRIAAPEVVAPTQEIADENDAAQVEEAPEPEASFPEPVPEPSIESVTKSVEPASVETVTNVVPLRPNRFTPLPTPVATPAAPSVSPEPSRPTRQSSMTELSASERNAFREIARALGAKADSIKAEDAKREPADTNDMQAVVTPPQIHPKGEDLSSAEADAAEETVSFEPASAPQTTELPVNPRVRDLIEIASRARGLAEELANVSEPESAIEIEDDGQGVLNLEIGAADEVEAELAEHSGPAVAAVADPVDAALASHARDLVDRLPIGVLISRLEIPIFLNRTLLDLLGYEFADEFHDAGGLEQMFRGRSPEFLNDAASGGAIPLVTHSGEIVAVEARVQAISWDGDPATMICLRATREADTLAKLRTAEQDLRGRDTEIRELHAILDTATDGVVLIDDDGRLLSVNRAAQALFGCEPNELVGEPFTSLLARESHQVAQDYLTGLRSSGVASVMNDGREVTGRARQGGSIPLFMTIGRLNAGTTQKFCAVLRDITSWKKAERELNDARKQAERASALKSDFLAKVSHEVRTPLNAILGFAEVIMDERFGPVGNDRYKDYLKDIHASGTHVMSLVNDLLDLSKIEAGRMELNFGAVDANKIVSECVSLMQPQAARERVVIRLSLAQRLPNIVADERSMRQIVLNLLSNAVKFNEPGGQVIVSTALTDAGHAVIRIRDTGIGMSEAETQIALEPFRQLATSRVSGGTGLGLPLTKALVEANRASFTIKSKKKEGTLIEVAFPPTRVLAE